MDTTYRLKVGIDSYCFHRFFGEVYPHQYKKENPFSMEDFLAYAKSLAVDGVSLESCFFPGFDSDYLDDVKGWLDAYGFDRVYAWGHPDGLEGGKNEKEFEDMLRHIEHAKSIGAKVMRVVGSSLMFRFEPHEPQLEKLAALFKEAVKVAASHHIKLAIENHIDYNSEEILWLLKERMYDGSRWVVLARDPSILAVLVTRDGWRRLEATPNTRLWTDDYTDVVSVIKW
jgi:sugar phosphate isomerase/epimerase